MKKIISITFAIACCSILIAQDIKKYTQENTIHINSNNPDSLDFSDLEGIGNAIADSRIVFLGEQGHGDAPAFLAKTRLIKYLHKKKGFNIIAFESDFFGLNVGWDHLLKTKTNTDSFLRKNIYPVWSICDAFENLLHKYIPQKLSTSNPMQVTGFDNQTYLDYSSGNLSRNLDSLLRAYHLPVTKELDYASEIIPLIDSLTKGTFRDTSQYSRQLVGLLKIKEQLSTILSKDNFWLILVDNLISGSQEYSNIHQYVRSNNIRDRQMALNILWLANHKYPAEKIIVWAHNTHISKFAGHYNNKFLNETEWMGSVIDRLKDASLKTYTIGFTSYSGTEGTLGRTQKTTIEAPEKNSFENWINESYNFAFVDFKKFNQANIHKVPKFTMKGHHHTNNLKAPWTKIFDGVFFIREVYPCKRIPIYIQQKQIL